MMTIASLFVLGIASSVIGILFLCWFAFTVACREHHAKINQAENTFWVRRGIIQPTTAAKISRFERGPIMKAICAVEGFVFIVLGVGALYLHAHPQVLRRHFHTDQAAQQPMLSPSAQPNNSAP